MLMHRLAQAERQLGDVAAQKHALSAFQKLHDGSVATRNKASLTQSQDSVTPQELGMESQPQ